MTDYAEPAWAEPVWDGEDFPPPPEDDWAPPEDPYFASAAPFGGGVSTSGQRPPLGGPRPPLIEPVEIKRPASAKFASAAEALHTVFGYDAFRGEQAAIIA